MTNLDKCKQIIDTESGRVLLYRDEVEAVLTAGDTISRRQAIDALGDEPEVWSGKDEYAQGLNNQWHYDRNAIKALPSAQPERTCVNCGRTVNNGGWYADGRTRCPIEEHYALPKDGYCHLWEKRNVTDDNYPERRTDE